ncbi:MAG: hypothetical protein FP816_03045 [Desulfobacteraceae bacterium]|nr:hypothetical protein [Desulfobacteraceae bacterium]MBU4000803.1 hypothetical protein [Pseudomonadota bacterium]MBU4054268.1 hypothetical protein [Pseudomonadota bacterium]
MKKDLRKSAILDLYMDCFEDFDSSDPICRKYCSLNLRCAIESTRKDNIEMLEEMVSANVSIMKFN